MTKKTSIVRVAKGYDAILADIVALIDAGRRTAVRTSNAIMTATYWGVGRRIVEQEQHGAARATYGDELISKLSIDLQARFGRGYSQPNLFRMRAFYLGHREILSTASRKSPVIASLKKFSTVSRKSLEPDELALVANELRLPWSCYARLLSVQNPEAQRFYEGEALRGGSRSRADPTSSGSRR